ncbi:MAG: sulfatase-like hydrolase/transferase [Aeoliella sp.]
MQGKSTSTDTVSAKNYYHPFLIALFPAANLYAANSTAVELKDLLLPAIAVLATTLIVYMAARFFCSDFEKAALLTSWTIAWFFSYTVLHKLLDYFYRGMLNGDSSVHGEYVLASWGILWLLGISWILKTSRQLQPVNSFLTSMALVLLVISAVTVGRQWYSGGRIQWQETPDSWAQQPVVLQKLNQPRDIYFLVFDRYAGAETLRKHHQLDNNKFLKQLRSRGFQVSEASCANYPRTILSICSTLNLSYLPDETRSDSYYANMIDNHLVGRSLKDMGYEYHHLGNWYQPLRSNENATKVYPTTIFPSEYADSLYAITPLSKVLRVRHKYEFVTEKFRQVAEMTRNEKPTFVYAHFLVPHSPYVFDRDGSKISWTETRYGDPKESYIRQLEGTNKLILNTVDKILQDSDQVPIIILQADEGPYLSQETRKLDRKQQILTRARILSAFLLPELDDETAVPENLTPVNTFRLIFREYFGADIELLPDQTYYWDQADQLGRPASKNKRYVDVTSLIAE